MVHVFARVLADRQWILGTTSDQVYADLHNAILHPTARLIVYQRRGGYIAAILSENVVPLARRGSQSLPLMFVVYALERDSIISAYQVSDVNQIAIPGDALWLK